MIDLSIPLKDIKGIPKNTSSKLETIDIKTVGDLIFHTPARYEDYAHPTPISEIQFGKSYVIRGIVSKLYYKRIPGRRLSMTEAIIKDHSGVIRAVWFNQPYIRYGFSEGMDLFVSGKISRNKNGLFLASPSHRKADEGPIGITPVYRRPRGLSSKSISTAISLCLNSIGHIEEFIPERILNSRNLPEINTSLVDLHFPSNSTKAMKAKRRLAFETVFLVQLLNMTRRKTLLEMDAPLIKFDADFVKEDMMKLPFSLTFAQKRSLFEILKDMSSGHPMNRLLQGDVGSGKTIVMALAALSSVRSGFQVAIMAPTEILAAQHYRTIISLFGKEEIPVCLFTSKSSRIFYGEGLESEAPKKSIISEISSGKAKIIIGTHSLISKRKTGSVVFGSLGLIVVDEQHRFGVSERAALSKNEKRSAPHFLSMSATPIPRTMAIAIFGDLDLSMIDELPKDRQSITTKIVPSTKREAAYLFIKEELRKGHQAFFVCPRIESDDEVMEWSETKNVKAEYEKLSAVFKEFKVAMLHGKMKPEEKDEIMESFRKGKTDLLVSTSVIEVGIDVPNATVMVIEDADRFGLAQLYQFKGRVGRGKHKSYCFLFSSSSSELSVSRLSMIEKAKSGLELAEMDLNLRGPGEFLGETQKGTPDAVMEALRDPMIIKESRAAAEEVMKNGLMIHEFAPLKAKLEVLDRNYHFE